MKEFFENAGTWLLDVLCRIGEIVWDWLSRNGPKILGALLILLIGWWLSVVIAKGLRKVLRRSKLDKGVTSFVYSVTKTVLLLAVIVSAVAQLGVNITSAIAALGAAGITAGLALKDTLSNFASGIFILFNRPFSTGDYIEVEESAGTVEEIELMFTTLRTPDNKHLVFPNSKLTENKIINHTAEKMRRLDLAFSLPYDADINEARKLILSVYNDSSYVIKDESKPITSGITDFGTNAVNFEVRAWIFSDDYWNARFELNENVKAVLDENGISMPVNQVDVTIKNK